MARASCERGNSKTCTICAYIFGLLIGDGWETTAGDPVVLGFTFDMEVSKEMEQIVVLFRYFQSTPALVKL
jgi:hypothetical protein